MLEVEIAFAVNQNFFSLLIASSGTVSYFPFFFFIFQVLEKTLVLKLNLNYAFASDDSNYFCNACSVPYGRIYVVFFWLRAQGNLFTYV